MKKRNIHAKDAHDLDEEDLDLLRENRVQKRLKKNMEPDDISEEQSIKIKKDVEEYDMKAIKEETRHEIKK